MLFIELNLKTQMLYLDLFALVVHFHRGFFRCERDAPLPSIRGLMFVSLGDKENIQAPTTVLQNTGCT